MEVNDSRSGLDRLRRYYEERELVCPACGYEDVDGDWRGTTDGRRVEYAHECPSCGVVASHTLTLTRS